MQWIKVSIHSLNHPAELNVAVALRAFIYWEHNIAPRDGIKGCGRKLIAPNSFIRKQNIDSSSLWENHNAESLSTSSSRHDAQPKIKSTKRPAEKKKIAFESRWEFSPPQRSGVPGTSFNFPRRIHSEGRVSPLPPPHYGSPSQNENILKVFAVCVKYINSLLIGGD